MNEVRVGIIGFGAIGRALDEAIVAGQAGHASLAAVLVRSPEKIEPGAAERLGCRFTTDAADFLDSQMDLVVEVAGHDALRAYAEHVLRAGKDLMVIAVGAFADAGLWERVSRLAHENPDKTVFCLDPVVCPCSTMYRIHPAYLAWTVEELARGHVVNRVQVDEETTHYARIALDRMLTVV